MNIEVAFLGVGPTSDSGGNTQALDPHRRLFDQTPGTPSRYTGRGPAPAIWGSQHAAAPRSQAPSMRASPHTSTSAASTPMHWAPFTSNSSTPMLWTSSTSAASIPMRRASDRGQRPLASEPTSPEPQRRHTSTTQSACQPNNQHQDSSQQQANMSPSPSLPGILSPPSSKAAAPLCRAISLPLQRVSFSLSHEEEAEAEGCVGEALLGAWRRQNLQGWKQSLRLQLEAGSSSFQPPPSVFQWMRGLPEKARAEQQSLLREVELDHFKHRRLMQRHSIRHDSRASKYESYLYGVSTHLDHVDLTLQRRREQLDSLQDPQLGRRSTTGGPGGLGTGPAASPALARGGSAARCALPLMNLIEQSTPGRQGLMAPWVAPPPSEELVSATVSVQQQHQQQQRSISGQEVPLPPVPEHAQQGGTGTNTWTPAAQQRLSASGAVPHLPSSRAASTAAQAAGAAAATTVASPPGCSTSPDPEAKGPTAFQKPSAGGRALRPSNRMGFGTSSHKPGAPDLPASFHKAGVPGLGNATRSSPSPTGDVVAAAGSRQRREQAKPQAAAAQSRYLQHLAPSGAGPKAQVPAGGQAGAGAWGGTAPSPAPGTEVAEAGGTHVLAGPGRERTMEELGAEPSWTMTS